MVAQRRTAEAGPKPDRPTPEVRESGRREGAAKRPPRPSRRPEVSGGDIRVSGESVRIAGMLDASGTAGRGGTLVATGGTVVLSGTAVLDVSGTAGGTLLVGGDYQGGRNAATRYLAEPVARARALTVEAGAQLRADGTRGDGGRVVLWSDRDTAFAGTISARGAVRGGDAEVSGKARLAFTGTADLRGTAGFGTLLLDPYNLTISTQGEEDELDASIAERIRGAEGERIEAARIDEDSVAKFACGRRSGKNPPSFGGRGDRVKRSGKSPFKGRQFTAAVILWAVRWYLQFPISYRNLA
ncbi:hypothetical protein ABAZ39_14805 (plasmid) [Azospirillum argentinense]|uniref:Uncharacterized protein n=1 Tax=Azospirillum argentinense TaxID=2970906 RepID=A0A060DK80_9PROT|nr:hypothetical protein ABAZ39_14805 [Azospirillum argentinense]EZQ06387.1 hypothetical protein ABAZ39_14780 [Azospirillum argentinense]KAA1056123.1 Large exoproteins involved in heme utilization or adhesion [Azospirillum argentinense]